ncbi:hypothetical protein [Streptomyces caniferus]|uniref:hypothetical protein n=1 Tax=Streptomyces caniferus TaxID=285557 RepID=UPI0037FD1613
MKPTSPADRLAQARTDDSTRRRRRVLAALDDLTRDGQPISVSAVARLAGVHRSLIYRHGGLHAAVAARAAQPPNNTNGPQVSRNSLLSDLANLTERNTRLAGHVARLEQRLSEALGQDAWRATGLGAPTDTDTLQRKIDHLDSATSSPNAKKTSRHPEPLTES